MPSTSPAATPSPSGAAHESDTAPSSLARPAAAAAATRARSASNSSRLPRPAISTRRWPPPGASSWATATFLSPAFASPSSTSALQALVGQRARPRTAPTTRVSAAVSSGAPLRVVTLIRSRGGHPSLKPAPGAPSARRAPVGNVAGPRRARRRPNSMPKTVILGAARTPFGKMGGASPPSTPPTSAAPPSPPRSSAPRWRPSRSSRSSSARCSRPARARFPAARPRSRAGSRRRSPPRRSTRSAPRACARRGSSTRPCAPATSTSAVAGGMESMSSAPYLLKQARFGYRMGDAKALDAMVNDGLHQPVQRQAHGRGGRRGRRRARDHARRHGQVRAALATSWRSRRPTRAACPRRSCR